MVCKDTVRRNVCLFKCYTCIIINVTTAVLVFSTLPRSTYSFSTIPLPTKNVHTRRRRYSFHNPHPISYTSKSHLKSKKTYEIARDTEFNENENDNTVAGTLASVPVTLTSVPETGERNNEKQKGITRLEMTSMSLLGLGLTAFILVSLTLSQDELQGVFKNVFSFPDSVPASGFGENSKNALTGISQSLSSLSPSGIDGNVGDAASNLAAVVMEEEQLSGEEKALGEIEFLAAQRLLNSAVPETATDVFSLVLGEGIAGSIGAIANGVVILILKLRENNMLSTSYISNVFDTKESKVNSYIDEESATDDTSSPRKTSSLNANKFYSDALRDGDYFLTRAAAFSLLEGVGISESFANILGTLFAVIPAQIIKINSNRRLQQQSNFEGSTGLFSPSSEAKSNEEGIDDDEFEIDFVEFFADTTKWLEYSVLSSDFTRTVFPGNPTLESASFGFLAAFSSQVYADILYRYTDYGPQKVKNAALQRSSDEWISLYVSKCFSSAALFGVYEYMRSPITRFFQSVLTGGVDSCLGSDDFDMCIETFRIDNPPTDIATTEAQLRALFTAMLNLFDRIGINFDGLGILNLENAEGDVRGLVVSFYSILNHFLPLY